MVTDGGERLYRIPEAAARLAISRSKLYEEIFAGRIRVVHIGGAVRIASSEIEAYIQRLVAEASAR